jgi:Flp pilus assembly protein CpaB
MLTKLRRSVLFAVLAAVFSLVALVATAASAQDEPKRGRKYVPPPDTARIEVTVVRASSGKPISNAAVVFHPMKGEKDKGAMELKTNEEGKAIIDVIPIGDTVRLQIIAPGFRTYGEDYKIATAERAITVKMVKPTEQYSLYKKNPDETAKPDANASPAPSTPPAPTAPPASPANSSTPH